MKDTEIDASIDIFKNISRAFRSERAAAFDCTGLKDMHRCILFNCSAIGSYLE